MRLDWIAAAFSAARGQMMLPHSPSRPSDSLPAVGKNHGRHGQKGSMRLSSSLQDFSTYSRVDPEGGGVEFEIEGSHTRPVPPRALHREGGGSSFSKEKPLPETPFIRKRLVRVAASVLCLFLLLSLLYVCSVSFSRYWSQNSSRYYVILDCGSTGTRVYVYESFLDHQKGNSHLPISLRSLPEGVVKVSSSRSGRAYQRMETEPGFDTLVRNESGLRTAIKPLLRWAEKQIPKHAHKSTSLFVYATAGVRRLPSSDSKWLLDKVWSILKSSSFSCQRDWIKSISGMEEAYYGWIALNYQRGTIGSVPRKETFGALDLGGSSLQVTFETKEALQGKTSLNLTIGDISHHLSAYSLSGYGLNDAFDKSVVHLLRKQPTINSDELKNGKIEIKHPCLHSGYKEQYTCSQCALSDKAGSPLVSRRSSAKGQAGIPVTLVGVPVWEECSVLAKTTVNLSEWSNLSPGIDCEIQPCALADSLPRPRGQFYAMSGFFVVYKFFNLTSDATLDEVLQKGEEFCEKAWEVAKNSVAPQPFIDQYCFRAPYIVTLLRDGLHIADTQVSIGSGSTTWTLGVALLQAGQALSSKIDLHGYRILHGEISRPVLISMFLLSLVLLFFALSCVGRWMPKFFRRPYLPLFRHNSPTSSSVLNLPYPFSFQRWSPISSGDGRVKMPLSPTVSGTEQHPFGMGHGLGGSSIQLIESSLYPSGVSVSHSYSSGSLGQMQLDSVVGSFWTPHRSQMQLQSRRSQSREDLSSSLAEIHMKG
uniref:Ectonucleoside triphosphate diphosphohydrolase 1 n=1 Tax=Anthurium amnicola TaxID=1678845 RepID=A0A1D1XC43_9ARAE